VKGKTFRYPPPVPQQAEVLREASLTEVAPAQINVRAAKDRLSSLLEEAARGHEIIITSDGQPKAKLVPMQAKRKRFKVDWESLKRAPCKAGPSAEELIREERDGRP
jgi:prevent-host-death family protein